MSIAERSTMTTTEFLAWTRVQLEGRRHGLVKVD